MMSQDYPKDKHWPLIQTYAWIVTSLYCSLHMCPNTDIDENEIIRMARETMHLTKCVLVGSTNSICEK